MPEGSSKTKEEIAEAYKSQPWWYDVQGFFILTFAYRSTGPSSKFGLKSPFHFFNLL